jgi:hypothetical protein
MASITESVGRMGGKNRPDDVLTVKQLLNGVGAAKGGPNPPLPATPVCDQKTIDAIQKFQLHHFGWSIADGRVDPNGPTLAKLNELSGSPGTSPFPAPTQPTTPPVDDGSHPGCDLSQSALINKAVKDARDYLDTAIRKLRGISGIIVPDAVTDDTKTKVKNIFKIDLNGGMSGETITNAFNFSTLLQNFAILRKSFNTKFPLECSATATNAAQVSNNFSDETVTFGSRFFPENLDGAMSNKDIRAVTLVHERAHTALRIAGHPGTSDSPVCIFPHLGFPNLSTADALKNAWCYEWLTASLQNDYSAEKYININSCANGGAEVITPSTM